MPGEAMNFGGWPIRKRLALLLVASALSLSCLGPPWVGSFRPWSGSVAFKAGLQCGMAEAEIAAIAQRFRRLQIHRPDSSPDRLIAQRGDTLIILGLKAARLETYQVTWTSGFTKQSSQLKHNVCSGVKYVEMHLLASSDLAGATIWLDGERIGEISRTGGFTEDIPIGIRALRVEKAGVGSWSTELRYDKSSSGYDRISVDLKGAG